MNIVDLSAPIDASFEEAEPVTHRIVSPAEGARHMSEEMHKHFGIDFDPEVLPDCEFLSLDTLTLTTHTGTHVDAPAHYGTTATYGTPRTVDELPLDWFHRPGFVLDLTGAEVGTVDAAYLEKEIARIGYQPQPMDIPLLHTGASQHLGTQRYFTEFVGLDGSAVEMLLDLGVKVIGTDGFSLDAPFLNIIQRYQQTGDRSVLWPAHFAGRRREFSQIERLTGLEQLPPYGFTISCMPVKVAGAGAGWARAVAFVD